MLKRDGRWGSCTFSCGAPLLNSMRVAATALLFFLVAEDLNTSRSGGILSPVRGLRVKPRRQTTRTPNADGGDRSVAIGKEVKWFCDKWKLFAKIADFGWTRHDITGSHHKFVKTGRSPIIVAVHDKQGIRSDVARNVLKNLRARELEYETRQAAGVGEPEEQAEHAGPQHDSGRGLRKEERKAMMEQLRQLMARGALEKEVGAVASVADPDALARVRAEAVRAKQDVEKKKKQELEKWLEFVQNLMNEQRRFTTALYVLVHYLGGKRDFFAKKRDDSPGGELDFFVSQSWEEKLKKGPTRKLSFQGLHISLAPPQGAMCSLGKAHSSGESMCVIPCEHNVSPVIPPGGKAHSSGDDSPGGKCVRTILKDEQNHARTEPKLCRQILFSEISLFQIIFNPARFLLRFSIQLVSCIKAVFDGAPSRSWFLFLETTKANRLAS
ncbi:unnamed protein product [Amoebophrya sp. A120]|nr:unnamed protein product [Amoebophrya sp. A120]|eukprot:GSA120T00000551001.1